jgi:UrcA family protein
MKTITKIIIAGAIAALSTTGAQAQQADVRTMSVRSNDLDLNTQAGQAKLESRINRAAKAVCGDNSNRTSISERQQFETCRTKAVASALSAVETKPTEVASTATK